MTTFLTTGVTSTHQGINSQSHLPVAYHCMASNNGDKWPMKHISNFFVTHKPEITHTAYGIIVDSKLSIPINNSSEKHIVFAIMELNHYKEEFEPIPTPLEDVLEARITDQDIVKLWRDNTQHIIRIGVSEKKEIGVNAKLAAIGLCRFKTTDSFLLAYKTSFFCNNRPTLFSVEHLKDTKLIKMNHEEYATFIQEFRKSLLPKQEQLKRSGSSEIFNPPQFVSTNQTTITSTIINQNEIDGNGCCIIA